MDDLLKEFGLHRINKRTLRFIYNEINNLLTTEEQTEICERMVNKDLMEMFRIEGFREEELLFIVLNHLSFSSNLNDINNLYILIELLVDPENFENGQEVSKNLIRKFNSLLKCDFVYLDYNEGFPVMYTFEEQEMPLKPLEASGLIGRRIQLQPSEVNWDNKYKWEGDTFVFSDRGEISFNSIPTKRLFEALTKKKGNWTTMNELRNATGKNDNYLRATIRQIEERLKRLLITIPSTMNDDLVPKPLGGQGAYRIKVDSMLKK